MGTLYQLSRARRKRQPASREARSTSKSFELGGGVLIDLGQKVAEADKVNASGITSASQPDGRP
jgi:hypothetical protein